MSRNRILVLSAFVFLVSISFYNNCANVNFGKVQNTSTIGNGFNPSTQASQEILFAICSVLDRCQGKVPFNTCMSGVSATKGIAATLGLPPGTYDPYSTLENAEASGTIRANLVNANSCVDTINILNCRSPSVKNAYNPTSSNPFSAVPNMIPAQACGAVFTNSHEYIYFGDQNNASLPGYSINTSSGVLTAIPNWPAQVSRINLAKISNDVQVILTSTCCSTPFAYSISPTTGILSAVSGSGTFQAKATIGSPTGLYAYSIDGGESSGWISTLNPSDGSFTGSTKTPNFPAPITNATNIVLSANGNFVYFIDPYDNALVSYSTIGGGLNMVTGTGTGTGTNVGDKTYGLTRFPVPNAGDYHGSAPYFDSGANVIYLYYAGATDSDNNWLVPYKINADGSLTTGTSLNVGTNPGSGVWTATGDSTGKYLFVSMPEGKGGIYTYSIAADGSLSSVSGPVFSGQTFLGITINRENSLIIVGDGGTIETASINMTSGVLTPVSSAANPCGGGGSLDSSESFVYSIEGGTPNSVCGFTVSPSGTLGTISGQSYPLAVPGSGFITSSVVVQTSP
jgi:hypothetical protein